MLVTVRVCIIINEYVFFFTERANFDILSRSCKPSCQMAYMGNHYGKTSTLSVLVMYSYTIVLLKKKRKKKDIPYGI